MNIQPNTFSQSDEYSKLPFHLYSAKAVREMDRIAIEEYGIDGFDLMSRAARFSFHILRKKWPLINRMIILCGSGNNAGDGYLVAEMAKKRDMDVIVFYASDPNKLKGDALSAYQTCIKSGLKPQPFLEESFKTSLIENSVIVDALLGTGLNTEVKGSYAQIINLANASDVPILALDIPSGLCATTGQVLGTAINASLTASFIGLKVGLFTGNGRQHAGEVVFSDLELTDLSITKIPASANMNRLDTLLAQLAPRDRSAHKGNCGHAFIIGGDLGYGGAIQLAAQACARMGAGLTTVVTQEVHRSALLVSLPEAMVITSQNSQTIEQTLQKATVIVIGPGLGQSAWSEKMLLAALTSGKQMLIDADAINLLSMSDKFKSYLSILGHHHIFTPHPGEAARMLKTTTKEIQQDRLKAVKEIQHLWGGNVLLKGSGSLICNSNGNISLCPYGNPGMASGGMGDVLSGLVGGLLAQGLSAEFALNLGTVLHARAADLLVKQYGERGLLASDLVPVARSLLNQR